ncbi:hypothetical protein ACF1G5_37715 [Streptomyces coeruleorubidus]|uniref:hypothetical protein n=1 Tax=Streptomyces coeruleorubidus TaxID=116188 RepID=UPI003702222F
MATLRSINVPHIRGYDFGIGVDRLSGTLMNQVVEPNSSPPSPGMGGVQTFDVSRVYDSRDLQSKLGIDIEASYGCASFGAGASARFSYMKDAKISSACLFMVVTATAKLADMSIDQAVLTTPAQQVIGRRDAFTARYGNMFCRACSRGGIFVGVMRVETESSSEALEIEAELKGAYGFFSAEAKAKFRNVTESHHTSVYCSLHAEGGPRLVVSDPTDPATLLQNANAWGEALNSKPDVYAKPYEWTLSPITIAEGPLPPNTAEIQHAQDILQFCARERTGLLDQLNLLDWIHDHPDRFTWEGAVTREAIRASIRNTQKDLDLVAQCASNAIDDPTRAVSPSTFGQRLVPPVDYPSAVIPDPLPQYRAPSLDANIYVPNLIGEIEGFLWIAEEYGIDEREEPAGLPPTPRNREVVDFMAARSRGDIKIRMVPPEVGSNSGSIVRAQFPAGGTSVPRGTEILLEFELILSG